jgi:hypothetical protein
VRNGDSWAKLKAGMTSSNAGKHWTRLAGAREHAIDIMGGGLRDSVWAPCHQSP